MRRREFITMVGGVVAVWPLGGQAQQSTGTRRIGMLMPASANDPEFLTFIAAFREGLRKLGWEEGRNIRFSYCWTEGDPARNGACAKELMHFEPDVLLSTSTSLTAAARAETSTIPIVFASAIDPVGSGLVPSLSHPAGNVTGFTNFEYDIGGKWLEILKQLAPGLSRVAFIMNASSTNHLGILKSIESAATSLGVSVQPAPALNATELTGAVEAFAREPGGGLIIPSSPLTLSHHQLLLDLAAHHRLPAIYPYRFIPFSGGLISYGADLAEIFRRAAAYVHRILNGENPSALPVQQPVKFELGINLRTAKALGLTVPDKLLALADDVIE